MQDIYAKRLTFVVILRMMEGALSRLVRPWAFMVYQLVPREGTTMRIRDIVMFGCGVVVGGVLLGAATGNTAATASHNRYKKLDIFASVLSYIENDYVEQVDGKKLIHGAIHGMMKTLDPYTVFIPPKQYQEMKAETSGEYGGPGLELRQVARKIIVIDSLPDSPALRAGIRRGDQLLKVDKLDLAGRSLYDVQRILRGRPGSRLSLTYRRKADRKLHQTVVIREQIRTQSVRLKMWKKGLAHIHIKSFQDRTERQLKDILNKLKRKGKLRGIVLDLRDNPGGLFDQSVRVADLFLPRGLIVVARGRNPAKYEREMAHEKGTWPQVPIVCLINRGSASASEIVAGALQDHRRAVMMGTLSFGKGSVQTIIDLADGSGLKMTIARYYTPLNRLIHGSGIKPDVLVKSSDDSDIQLAKALAYLQQPSLYRRALGRGLPKSLQKRKP